MANFEIAYKIILENEGNYSDNLKDFGKETYRGISRRYNPSWEGWKIIDTAKEIRLTDFQEYIKNNQELNKQVKEFYRNNIWNTILGNEIPDQEIANYVFDCTIHHGNDGVKWLQIVLNCLNKNQYLFPDMPEDGVMGDTTLTNLKRYLNVENSNELILKAIRGLRIVHFIDLMRKYKSQEVFAKGWLKRV